MNLINFLAQAHQHDASTESFFEHVWHVSDWLPHYLELINDPAHVALELSLMLIFDGLLFGLIWRALRNYIRSHHTQDVSDLIEAEHDYHELDMDNMKDLEKRLRSLEESVTNLQLNKSKKK